MSTKHSDAAPPLTGAMLLLAGFVLAMANFMAVLDTSIANVALPHIAGALGASSSEGTSVITFYAIAEAIAIPLTGWLSQRFGSVKVFLWSMAGFGVSSVLCGLAPTLDILILFRVVQGFCAGPMMPLSQSLLLRITPKHQHPMALALWSMTVIVAPVCGPVLGGVIADTIGWEWSFFINVPVAIVSVIVGWRLLTSRETETERTRVDYVGLILLAIWVGALQLFLDGGKERDWFESSYIATLAIVSAIAFAAFVIWELTDKAPIVNLRLLTISSFSLSTLVLAIAYGVFFGSVVLVPQWLQTNLGYTATWSGYMTAFNGMLGVLVSPLVAYLIVRFDPRAVAFIGVLGLAAALGVRTLFNTDISFGQMIPAQLAQGAFLPLMFVPMLGIALAKIPERDVAAASGLMTFARTMAGAIATSIVTSSWERSTGAMRSEVVGSMQNSGAAIDAMTQAGLSSEQAAMNLSRMVDGQAMMLATNQVFAFVAPMLACAALLIWFTPKPPATAMAAAQSGH
jgi:MFS transporter, DHA2 family, multidrug resistance protein